MRKTWDSFDKLNGKVVKSIDYIGTNHKMEDHEFVSGKVIVLVFEDGSKLRVDCATNNENGIIFFANVPHQPRAAQEQSENVPLSGALAECDGSDMSSVFISALKIANQATDDYLQKHSQLKQ